MSIQIWHVALLLALSLNIFVTIFLITREDLERFQKIAQIIIVWLIPFFAAIGLWFFNRQIEKENPAKRKSGGGHNDSDSTDAG